MKVFGCRPLACLDTRTGGWRSETFTEVDGRPQRWVEVLLEAIDAEVGAVTAK